MGILRSDRITGLGGANAIKGSVEFTGDASSGTAKGVSLNITGSDKDDLNFAGNDFTFEAWVFPTANIAFNPVYCQAWGLQIYIDTTSDDNNVKIYVASSDTSSYAIGGATSANGTIKPDAWNHVAFSRSGNSWTIFTNGTAATSSTSSQSLVSSNADYTIGIFNSIGSGNDLGSYFGFNGYISNLRIRTGAHYLPSTNFTPPVGELQKTSDTVLLCCQSSADSTKEETGKTLVPTSKNTNDKLPTASKFTPNSPVGFSTTSDVGSQYGSTFNGFGNFATSTYMVPPGGNTRERNRGRALWAGGDNPGGGDTNLIDFIQIQSGGIGFDFGDLTVAANQTRGVSSSTRGVFGGGRRPHPATTNTIDFVTIANTANAQDFGDLTDDRAGVGEISSSTRGIFAAGYNPSNTNTIDYITIATLGNATDFGDTSELSNAIAGTQSTTRGILGGGNIPSSPNASNVIQYLTIATTGNTQDFGDLSDSRHSASGTSNGVRAVFMGGDHLSPAADNTIDYITIASTGDATDFGDLGSTSIGTGGATSDKIRGVFGLGYAGPNYLNVIQQVTIATTGNSVDIGELTLLRHQPGCLSDAHGGLE